MYHEAIKPFRIQLLYCLNLPPSFNNSTTNPSSRLSSKALTLRDLSPRILQSRDRASHLDNLATGIQRVTKLRLRARKLEA